MRLKLCQFDKLSFHTCIFELIPAPLQNIYIFSAFIPKPHGKLLDRNVTLLYSSLTTSVHVMLHNVK